MTENSYLTSLHEMLGSLACIVSQPATISLRSNVDTIVLLSLNRYVREQLLSLSLRWRLGGPACECNGDVLAPLERQFNTSLRGSCSVAMAGPAGPKHEALCASIATLNASP